MKKMGQPSTVRGILARVILGPCALALLALAAPVQAAPFHARTASLDVTGLNHACGAAVDSKGDFYAASAGESKVKVYNPSHVLLTEIVNSNEPCGLAVDSQGTLFVLERATGKVIRYIPNSYPFSGSPTYGAGEEVAIGGFAKGIAVDRAAVINAKNEAIGTDDSLYVVKGSHVDVYRNEVQGINLQNASGGTFSMAVGGQSTPPLPYNASHLEVQKALEGLSTVGANNVVVTTGNLSPTSSAAQDAVNHRITFIHTRGLANISLIEVDASALTGSFSTSVSDGGFVTSVGEGTLSEASGVAAYTYSNGSVTEHYLWVADAKGVEADRLYLLAGPEVKALALRRELKGANTPDGSFGFGAAGAYLAADPGNRSGAKCVSVSAQACSAGHLFLYDAAHKALDEFDASGEYLDRTANAAFADAEPTAVAIDRSGGANDGTTYVTAGAGAGAKALAFKPLTAPKRETLGTPLSHILKNARAVATDSHGDVYAGAESAIHVYGPTGTEIVKFEDKHKPTDTAVDSLGNLYVLDENNGFPHEREVTYYSPSAYPPVSGTTYTRRASAVVTEEEFAEGEPLLKAIAVNPGPGEGKDHLFVGGFAITHEYDSAKNGSTLLNEEFGKCVPIPHQSIAVNGTNGTVYIGVNADGIYAVSKAGTECQGHIDIKGSPSGKVGFNPYLAVDQSNGHVIEYDGETGSAHEYDAAGSFVAEFGSFTEGITRDYRVATDSSCAIHEPPLDETTTPTCKAYDPANGNAYIAWDDPKLTNPPFDVNAFGPLDYGPTPPTPEYKLTVEKTGKGSGKVTSSPAGIDCGETCSAKYVEDTAVTLVAEADSASKSTFVGWTGCDSVNGKEECVVSMATERKVKAEFDSKETEEAKLEVELDGPASGMVTSEPTGIIECEPKCSAKVLKNSKVTLVGAPGAHAKAVQWAGCDSVSAEDRCLVTMSVDRKVIATFDFETPLLTVVKKGGGTGTVTSEPTGIDCGATCTAEFELNEGVTLEAEADQGSKFDGWTGCNAEPSETECEVSMEEPREVTATFDALPQVVAKPAHPILYDEATLRGEVDPSGLKTEYRFEYLSQEEYEANGESFEGAQPTPKEELAPTEGFVAVEAPLLGLEEGTEYRFRLRAMNLVGPAPEGEGEGTFETLERRLSVKCPNDAYRFGLSANLPDCRAYELVTPAQTDGLTPYAANDGNTASGSFSNWLTVQRGESAGERLSYFTEGTLPGFEGNGILDGYRAEREAGDHPAGGWRSALFSPNYAEAATGFAGRPHQLGIASDQLYSSWDINPEPDASEQALDRGVYLRTPVGFEALGQGSLGKDLGALSRYVSAGGAHAIFSSKAHLEEGAPPEGNVALYDRAAGSAIAHVLTLPPAGASEEEQAEFLAALRSKEQASFQGASEDGAAVIFKAGVALYVRLDDASTEKLSPSIANVGDTLACAAGPLLGLEHQRDFQWLRNATPIPGASGSDISNTTDYTAKPADEGAALQCQTVAKRGGTGSVAVSAPVDVSPLEAGQPPQPPVQIATPTPPSPAEGTVETCNAGSWKGAESLAYQWYSDGEAIAGATAQTYKVQASDVPGTLQCVVSGSNAAATVARASGLASTSPSPAEAAPVATAQAAVKTTYAGVSEDGRYVFFVLGDGESPTRLFRFDTQSEIATEIAAAGFFAEVSPDGTHAFFSSTEALSGAEENDNGEEAEAGEHNLYVWNGTGVGFVAQLSAGDFKQNAFAGIAEMNLAAWTRAVGFALGTQTGRPLSPTRSTPDGGSFVFQSHARLTAYDNEEVGEIYRYDPAAKAGERLLCVSCDPSGAPPSADALLEDLRSFGGGPPLKDTTMIASLTDSGQEVFFQSFDRLLPEDANEVEDVYEWRAKGAGEGTEECKRQAGCLALISSGQGEVPSYLYAMSADGRDVFLQTKEKLVGADVAGSPSIYDARAGGGIPEPAEPAPCQGDACQGQGSEPPVLPNPASAGAGESPEVTPKRRPCAKGKHRVKGRCVPTKHHKRRHRRTHANRGGNR
jgi:hypothetical protein